MPNPAFQTGANLAAIAIFAALFLFLLISSGLAAALVGMVLSAPLLIVLCIGPSILTGAVWAGVAALLKRR
jgi:hypothetical protein